MDPAHKEAKIVDLMIKLMTKIELVIEPKRSSTDWEYAFIFFLYLEKFNVEK